MRGPKIISAEVPPALDRIMARQAFRYGLALVTSIFLLFASHIDSSISAEIYRLTLFIAIVCVSALAGFGPGILATFLLCIGIYFLHPKFINADDVRLLLIEGILVSLVGGTLRSARRKTNMQLAANLRLEQQILEIGDDERERIGHDLHDGLGQHLTGISLLSETTAQQIQAGVKPDPANIETITRLVSEAVRITRDLAKTLSPMTLEKNGLIAAIEELSDTASAIFGIECICEFDGQRTDLNRTRSLHVFRIVQEAVNNSVRHGKAKHVTIELSGDNRLFIVKVRDDGSGLSHKTTTNPGLGLRIMQYRARMLDASLTVERASEAGGTIVTCTCPIGNENGVDEDERRT